MQPFLHTIQKLKLKSTRTYFLIFVMVVGVAIRITMNFHNLTSCTWWEQCWSPSQTEVLWGWRGQSRRNWRVNKWPPSTSSWSSPSTGTTSSTSIVGVGACFQIPTLIWTYFCKDFSWIWCVPLTHDVTFPFSKEILKHGLYSLYIKAKKKRKKKPEKNIHTNCQKLLKFELFNSILWFLKFIINIYLHI